MASSARTYIHIPELDRPNEKAMLNLLTHKPFGGGLSSFANIEFHQPNGIVTLEMFGDYRKQVVRDRNARATQKAIDTQHSIAFSPEVVDNLKNEALAFYAAKV